MKFYGELQNALLEKLGAPIASASEARIVYRTDTKKPYLDDGTTVDQVMMEKHLPAARRSIKVQLDDTGTGNEVSGIMPSSKGGTGIGDYTGHGGKNIQVNAGGTGLELGYPSIPIAQYFYIGSESVDTSWRIGEDSGNLTFEKRIGGTWTLQFNIEG